MINARYATATKAKQPADSPYERQATGAAKQGASTYNPNTHHS